MFSEIWNRIAETFSGNNVLTDVKEGLSQLFHRQQTWNIVDDTGKTIYFAPKGIDSDEWQKMIKAKIGGETDWPWDIQNMHIACSMTAKMLEGRGVKPVEIVPILMEMDIVPERLLPDFALGPKKPENFDPGKSFSSQIQSLPAPR